MKKLANNNFSRQKGFTLIELVVVIVILGILAATAAPKFIDLTGDARKSVMQGLQGSVNSAINMVHAKAIVSNEAGDSGQVTINGVDFALAYGYPVSSHATLASIEQLIELDNDTDISYAATTGVFQHDEGATPATCIVTYENATKTGTVVTPAKTELDASGC